MLAAALFGLLMFSDAHGQEPIVGKSRSDQWLQTITKTGHPAWRELAIASGDRESEMIVEFFPEMGGTGMNVSFVDNPYRPCNKEVLKAIKNTSIMLDRKPLPGTHGDSFTAGCAYEKWVEHVVVGVDANVAIVEALLKNRAGAIRLSSGDGTFDHTYSVKGFRELEHGALAAYQSSKGYRLVRSMGQ